MSAVEQIWLSRPRSVPYNSAEAYGAETDAEREALEAIYAYEEVLSIMRGKKTRAVRT